MNNCSAILITVLLMVFLLSACQQEQFLFAELSGEVTGIDFSNTVKESEDFNINEYMYAHDGGGVALGDVNNDGLVDVFFTANQLPNRLYLNEGDFKFRDVTESAGLEGQHGPDHWTTGVTMVDINGDGWLDIYVNQVSNFRNFTGHNQLYINNGDGTFTERSAQYNLDLSTFGQQAIFFDYDLDGDLDMYQLNHSLHEQDVFVRSDQRVNRDSLAGDILLRNDNKVFVDVSGEAGIYSSATGYGLSVAVADLDDNGCPDIFVSNDFHENDFIYYNQCDGTFVEGIEKSMGHTSTFSMGCDIADLNNDGRFDIMTLDMKPEDEVTRKRYSGPEPYEIFNYKRSYGYHFQYSRNMLQINQGNLFDSVVQFSEIGQMAGVDATDWSWSVLIQDYDNDGWKDIFITNGIVRSPIDLDYLEFIRHQRATKGMSSLQLTKLMPEGKARNYAYKNLGGLQFENVSGKWGLDLKGCSMGSAFADLDNDGDLDLVINNLNARAAIFKNNSDKNKNNHYLKISLKGSKGNSKGIGTKVRVKVSDKILVQELQPTRGWLSSSDFNLVFGVGQAKTADEISIRWVDGKVETRRHVRSDQVIVFDHESAGDINISSKREEPIFTKVDASEIIPYQHRENEFNDFERERLMPHLLSREGPKMVIADIDGNGLEDVLIGGASGQAAHLYFQLDSLGKTIFREFNKELFEADADKEDTDAAVFDTDQDGDLDIVIISGGGQHKSPLKTTHRLYINDGRGNFTKSKTFPVISSNGSCVVAEDFNQDGKIDLFVGSRSVVGAYGLSPDSYLLWNRGNGNFIRDTTNYASPMHRLGMVTDAVWNSKEKELIVVGEWMPITILKFETEGIVKNGIPNTSGFWNVIYESDLNNDGVSEYLVGNLGQNTDLKPLPDNPVKLIVNDWDQNGQVDPLITYFRQDQEWIIHHLQELKRQMPLIRNRYQSNELYASHSLKQVFSDEDLKLATIKKVELLSSIILSKKGRDNYQITPLPLETQYSPTYGFFVDDFNKDSIKDILVVGNSFHFAPWVGRLDASYGALLLGEDEMDFRFVDPIKSGFCVWGEARDIKSITVKNEKWLMVSKNNDRLSLFRFSEKSN